LARPSLVKGRDGAADDSAADLDRSCRSIDYLALRAADLRFPFLIDRPVKRDVRRGEMGGASGNRFRVQPVGLGQAAADPHALELLVCVARIIDGRQAGGLANLLKLGAAPCQQRPEHPRLASGKRRRETHSGEAAHAGAAVQAHQQGLGLVVEMMGGDQSGEVTLAEPPVKQPVTLDF
jgi:hypothetical protein